MPICKNTISCHHTVVGRCRTSSKTNKSCDLLSAVTFSGSRGLINCRLGLERWNFSQNETNKIGLTCLPYTDIFVVSSTDLGWHLILYSTLGWRLTKYRRYQEYISDFVGQRKDLQCLWFEICPCCKVFYRNFQSRWRTIFRHWKFQFQKRCSACMQRQLHKC